MLLLAGATTLGAAGAGAVAAFAVTAGIERGLPDAMAGILLSAGSLLGAVVRALAGRIVDRYGAQIALPLTASLLGTAAVGAAMLAVDEPWAYVVGIVLALGPGWGWTGLTHFVVSRTAGPATPAATGIVQTGSYLGSGAGPLLFGIAYSVAAGSAGGTLIWLAVAAAQLIATAIVIVLVRVVPPPVSVVAPPEPQTVAASIPE
jgi:nitrate/nitrite transporter NarK